MIITEEMIELVKPFATEEECSSLDFKNHAAMINKIIHLSEVSENCEPLCFTYVRRAKDGWYCMANNLLYIFVTITNEEEKECHYKARFLENDDPNTLEKFILAGKLAAQILKAKPAIDNLISMTIPVIKQFILQEEIKSNARFCFFKTDTFFSYGAFNGKVDTEEKMSQLWMKPREIWTKAIDELSDGKQHSFAVMRKVFTAFELVCQDITEKKLKLNGKDS